MCSNIYFNFYYITFRLLLNKYYLYSPHYMFIRICIIYIFNTSTFTYYLFHIINITIILVLVYYLIFYYHHEYSKIYDIILQMTVLFHYF